jgi:hypothetical protein
MEEVLHLRAKFNSLRLQSLSLVPLTAKKSTAAFLNNRPAVELDQTKI